MIRYLVKLFLFSMGDFFRQNGSILAKTIGVVKHQEKGFMHRKACSLMESALKSIQS
jgi:hypothetical protein